MDTKSVDDVKNVRKVNSNEVIDLTESADEAEISLESKIHRGEIVLGMLNSRKPWVRCKVVKVYRKKAKVIIRVRTLDNGQTLKLDKYSIARIQNHGFELKVPKRVVAGVKESNMSPGTIVLCPFDHNQYRYLVIKDDGTAGYFKPEQIYPIAGQSIKPWMDAFLFLKTAGKYDTYYLKYLLSYWPRRTLIRILPEDFKTKQGVYKNGQLVSCRFIDEDCDLLKVRYDDDDSQEVLYKGSLRVRKRIHENELGTSAPDLTKNDDKMQQSLHPELIIDIKTYYDAGCKATGEGPFGIFEPDELETSSSDDNSTGEPSKVVNFDKLDDDEDEDEVENSASSSSSRNNNASHQCNPECLLVRGGRNEQTVIDLKDEFRDTSNIKIPLKLGWRRELRETNTKRGKKSTVVYEAPCGKEFKQLYHLKRYLFKTRSKLDIDYFTDDPDVDLQKKHPEVKAFYYKDNVAINAQTGKPLENKDVSVFNDINEERLAIDFTYAGLSFLHPRLKENNFSLNAEFKSGCDCQDDCHKQADCSCHQLTEESYGINPNLSMGPKIGYVYKRLFGCVRTGIFECNDLCKCSSKCGNRVVQNGISFRLQIRKTPDKGWALITLDDIPAGAFVCTYSAEILDDADKYGNDDMYFADMDFITVNESNKIFTDDEDDRDKESGVGSNESSSEADNDDRDYKPDDEEGEQERIDDIKSSSSSHEESKPAKSQIDMKKEKKDEPEVIEILSSSSDTEVTKPVEINMNQQVKRNKAKKSTNKKIKKSKPKRNKKRRKRHSRNQRNLPRFKKIYDILGGHDFTLDARMSGNVGRFCNHSCDPNSFVQSVFIDTHDLRFPVVALFSSRTIPAFEEITWNYGYVVGSIPGRNLPCHCGAKECKGRIL